MAQDLDDFSASNGWLEAWRKRFGVRSTALCGESAEVPEDVVEDWAQRLPDITAGYCCYDIFNADETGLFYRALPNRTMAVKSDPARGVKSSKERMTVLLACSAAGEKLKPLVIGKSRKPRCFMKNDILPVKYVSNKKAWMTSSYFDKWLNWLNNKMKLANRNILLLVDNCSAHPNLQKSNVKVVFLPPNTTSKLQPCDAGIIQNVKLLYRKRLVRHVITLIDEASTATEVVKGVTIRDAIHWLDIAWDGVKDTTIQKCFRKCGFETPLDITISEATTDVATITTQAPDDIQQHPLFPSVMGDATWEAFVQCDHDTVTHNESEEADLVRAIGASATANSANSDSDGEGDDDPVEVVPSGVTTKDCRGYAQTIINFGYEMENPEIIQAARALETVLLAQQIKSAQAANKQSSIKDFFVAPPTQRKDS